MNFLLLAMLNFMDGPLDLLTVLHLLAHPLCCTPQKEESEKTNIAKCSKSEMLVPMSSQHCAATLTFVGVSQFSGMQQYITWLQPLFSNMG